MWLIIPILLVIHISICILLVGAVLMQLPRSEGLGAAFGGGMTENLFGAQTTHVLTKLTVWLGIGFFVVTLLLAMAFAHNRPSGTRLEKELLSSPPVTAPAAATPAAASAEPSPAAPAASPAPAAAPAVPTPEAAAQPATP